MALHQQLAAIVQQLHGAPVGTVICKLSGSKVSFLVERDGIEVLRGMPDADEVEQGFLGIVAPAEVVHVGVERLGEIGLLASLHIVTTQTLAVGLIAIALHGEPGYEAAIG